MAVPRFLLFALNVSNETESDSIRFQIHSGLETTTDIS